MRVKSADIPGFNAVGSVTSAIAGAALARGLDLTVRELYALTTLTKALEVLERMLPDGSISGAYELMASAASDVFTQERHRSTFESLAAKGLVELQSDELKVQLSKEGIELMSEICGGLAATLPELDSDDVRVSLNSHRRQGRQLVKKDGKWGWE
ncbi:hypothetical protein [Aquabacterium sp.]|uniref:hypothetical protein n=1 Tax=Aquabacterium sp. TaxID=1872578 RepID=UPI003BB0467A